MKKFPPKNRLEQVISRLHPTNNKNLMFILLSFFCQQLNTTKIFLIPTNKGNLASLCMRKKIFIIRTANLILLKPTFQKTMFSSK